MKNELDKIKVAAVMSCIGDVEVTLSGAECHTLAKYIAKLEGNISAAEDANCRAEGAESKMALMKDHINNLNRAIDVFGPLFARIISEISNPSRNHALMSEARNALDSMMEIQNKAYNEPYLNQVQMESESRAEAAEKENADLRRQLEEANADAERLSDELKIILLKTGVVWEEAGENSPAMIMHFQRIRK